MNLSSFLTSVGTSFLIFVILVLLFTWLSKKSGNAVIYYPNRILRGLEPNGNASRSCNPLGWVGEALKSTEKDVISASGVDTAVYFVFLSTMFGIMVLSGLLLLPTLLPVAATGGATEQQLGSPKNRSIDLDRLSMANIEAKSPRLWAFLGGVYWVSFVTYFMLWKAYNHVSQIRAAALQSPEVKSEQFAILVRDIPEPLEGQTRKEQVDSYFKTIYPDTFYRTMMVTNNKEVNKLAKELKAYEKKLARAEAAYAKSQATSGSDGTKPTHKTGFLGLVGAKVDTIEFYSKKISEVTPKLESEQKTTIRDKQLPAAVVFFTSRVAAAAAAQSLHAQIVTHWTVDEAPEPRDIIWSNLKIKFFHRQARQYIVYFIVALTILFYMIPIGLVSAFTTLNNLKKRLPFLKPILELGSIKTILGAYLPQLALIVFLALLPKFLMFLSKIEGIPSLSHSVRAASGKYFYFSVLNVFIGVTITGTLYKSLDKLMDDPKSIVSLLAENIPGNSTFFLTFVALKFFVGYGLELSRLIPLIIFHIKKKFLCKTEDEIKEAWFPGDLKYQTRVPGDLLILTIIICYSVIAPLVIPFGAAYFGFGWLILRNQALKVYVPSYESDGRIWPHLFKRVMAALLLYQVTMFGYFGIKKFFYTPLLIPLPILSLLFIFICNKKFYRSFQDTALEVAVRELKESPNMERIFSSFIPESLGNEKHGNNQFEDAVTQVSRTSLVV